MKKLLKSVGLFYLFVNLTSCDLEKEIALNLPEYESQLTVECYLENGQPMRMTVFESTSYFDRPEPVLVPDARVIITHHDSQDTLFFRPGFDKVTGKFYTHTSPKLVKAGFGDVYSLLVTDSRGRQVTGTTRFLNPVKMDTLYYKFDDENEALVSTSFKDDPNVENRYRFTIHRDSLSERKGENDNYSSDRLNNGKKIQLSTRYKFDPEDTVFVTLYHIEKPYYEFINSMRDAMNANGNPFAQPSTLHSTVQGGIGIFTNLVYDRRRIIIKQ